MQIRSGAVTLSTRDVNDLCTLIEHVRRDMSYMEGGTFVHPSDESRVDTKDLSQTARAIEIIKRLILDVNTKIS